MTELWAIMGDVFALSTSAATVAFVAGFIVDKALGRIDQGADE